MRLAEIVETSRALAHTRSRLEKIAALTRCLARLTAPEIPLGVHYLAGNLPQGRINISAALLRAMAAVTPTATAGLTLIDTDNAFAGLATIGGRGAQAQRQEILGRLYARATAAEQEFLTRLLAGALRQGALEGVMLEAIAHTAQLPLAAVRRAAMIAGDIAEVARAALLEGQAGLARFALQLLQPLQPMLAQSAADIDTALQQMGLASLEYKIDGARVQVHKCGDEVRVFTRALNDVSAAVPEIVQAVRALPAAELILDGEAIALRADGRPRPFQLTMRRFGRKRDDPALREEIPLSVFFFDCIYAEGQALIDRPSDARFAALSSLLPENIIIPRTLTDDPAHARAFLAQALGQGHEGVMAKAPHSLYEAGNRGSGWLKVKPAHTLDLVVLAAEWGNGRRQGWLSNLHLGAREPHDKTFVMLGKTFKGLTDAMLAWQTQRLKELALTSDGYTVTVRPELVVEVAFNEVQASPHYPAGLALRFARVKRYRTDKAAAQADTLETVRAIYARSCDRQDQAAHGYVDAKA